MVLKKRTELQHQSPGKIGFGRYLVLLQRIVSLGEICSPSMFKVPKHAFKFYVLVYTLNG